MSKYTPTTEDVRYRYVDYREKEGDYTPGEFARWLAAHDAEVRASVLAEQGEPEWGRAVHSPEELDALPAGAVVRDAGGDVYIKERRPWSANPWLDLSSSAGSDYRFVEDSNTVLWQAIEPQATILWLPVEENGENDD